MTPQERELIESVFNRLAQMAGAPKDPEAQALIAERLRGLPDATYGLVQAVAVQEVMLKQASAHIADLERRLAQGGPAPAAGGGFLGGGNPWAGGGQRGASPIPSVQPAQPMMAPQPPAYAQPAPQPSPWGQAAPAGGFLRNAATTAAGVAGGMLLAEGVSSLFGGHHGGFGGGSPWGGSGGMGPEMVENVTVNNYYGDSASTDDGSSFIADSSDGDSGDGGDWA